MSFAFLGITSTVLAAPQTFDAPNRGVLRAAVWAGEALGVRVSVEMAPVRHASRFQALRCPPELAGGCAPTALQPLGMPLHWEVDLDRPAGEVLASLVATANGSDPCDRYALSHRSPDAWSIRQTRYLEADGTCADAPDVFDAPLSGFPRPPLASVPERDAPWDWLRAVQGACPDCDFSRVRLPAGVDGSQTRTLRDVIATIEQARPQGQARQQIWWFSEWWISDTTSPTIHFRSGPTVDLFPDTGVSMQELLDEMARDAALGDRERLDAMHAQVLGEIASELAAGRIDPWQAAGRRHRARKDAARDLHDQGWISEDELRARVAASGREWGDDMRRLGERPRELIPPPP